ncbi:rRNA maturation RNase YbeY [Tenacibaculum skagerrakense]|uniref:Endoribonuclease YbeY n=1 Tax=Tenacibaculum skagerrakense TaxID=186571 RepID=A0A4R2P1F1_9FLAO|nr:rRNA maturation RNase YbeY [Tenacibaculum skagerrakense]TCP27888.1 rRNA maturation RNase YbeY [Tenacibaculum skagerrakense]
MIAFNYETDFILENEEITKEWIVNCAEENDFEIGEINYIFCDDEYLHKINMEFLQHDTLTDIISFDYTMGKLIGGDIFISVPRVKENAKEFGVTFKEELHRVIIHGVLHYMGYKDKTDEEKQLMRDKENSCLKTVNL